MSADARPLLFTYRRCPYAMRARMALLLAGVAFNAHEIELRHKPATLLQASPKGTVPVLIGPDGRVIDQSWDIVRWALTRPDSPAAAQDAWARAQSTDLQALLATNDSAFKYHLDRYKYPERFGSVDAIQRAEVIDSHRQHGVEVLIAPLATRLSAHPFLGGRVACATDLGLFPFVRQFAAIDRAWFDGLPFPSVHQWLATWAQSTLFEACMVRLPAQADSVFPMAQGVERLFTDTGA